MFLGMKLKMLWLVLEEGGVLKVVIMAHLMFWINLPWANTH